MSTAALTVLLLGAWWAAQLALAVAFARAVTGSRPPAAPSRWPRAAVVMPVRGADPTLAAAVRGVLDQDYPSLELQVVVDSRQDPAWRVVEAALAGAPPGRARLTELERRSPTCSLVCNGVVQALDALEPSVEMLAFCASDTVWPRDWLRLQAAALADPAVGATLGNRWYVPRDRRLGSAVRFLWNAAAVVVMWAGGIPWSGALALRPADVRRSGLRGRWERGLVEDVPASPALRALGLRTRFEPRLLAVSHEGLSLPGAWRFLRRQMLWARLYSPAWPLVVLHAAAGASALLGPLAAAGWCLAGGRVVEAGLAILALAAYVPALAALLGVVERALARAQPAGREPWPARGGLTAGQVLLGVPLAQLAYAAAVVSCLAAREVQWRGVTYRFGGPWDVRRLGPDDPP